MIAVQTAGGQPSLGFVVVALIGAIPILGIVCWTAVKILGPVGQALAQRLGGGSPGAAAMEKRLDRLGDELDQVRGQLAETHERLEFAERLLAQGRTTEKLAGG